MSVAVAPGKQPEHEGFPVASLLLAPAVRSPVLGFYRFVRIADDIADAPQLSGEEKLRRLDALEVALQGFDAGVPAAAMLALTDHEHGTGIAEARLLLSAFRQDAVKSRYADWDELLAYCRRSADPVGRFLLRLHREDPAAEPPSDALCTALQLLNHLQDLARDRARLDRIYLPLPWLAQAGGEEGFFAPGAAAHRRPVLDAALDQVDALIAEAEALPGRLKSRRLAAQAAATLACARAQSRHLRRHDPIDGAAVGPSHVVRGAGTALLRLAAGQPSRSDATITRAVVRRSRSSFRLGMACLEGERRRAIRAVYAFCRVVDDLADGAAPAAERRRFLDGWRAELAALDQEPRTPVGRELAWACRRFDLPQGELGLLLEGMATDAEVRVRLADDLALERYCRAVAGSVGLLAVRIFGAKGAETFALRLAKALQLVNILRDVEEDAARERVYLPVSRLAPLGIPDDNAAAVIAHPYFDWAWNDLAEEAADTFAAAEAALAGLDRRPLQPALLMLRSYRPLLDRLRREGWQPGRPRLRLAAHEHLRLLWLALRGAA